MMNYSNFLLCLFAALSLPTPAFSSDNGLLYKCDETKLAAEDMCYFVATGSETMGPHNIDRSVAEDGFRQVSDASGSPLRITPKPWTQGDHLTQSSDLLDDDNIAYANVFELIAPLRDAMMYDPTSLTEERWAELSKSLVDCNIKENDTTMQKGDRTITVYSVAGVYTLLKAAGGRDTHHSILQFLEEGAIELVCLAVPSLVMDHCDAVRAANSVTTEPSTCWHQAYKELYGSDPGANQAATNAEDATTNAPATNAGDATTTAATTNAGDATTTAAATNAGDATTTAPATHAGDATTTAAATNAGDATTTAPATNAEDATTNAAATSAGDATTNAPAISAGTGRGLPSWLGLCVAALLTPWL